MKILYVTTIGSTMGFFYEHFKMLMKNGCEIELACGNAKPISEKIASLRLPLHTLSFSRSPVSKDNLIAYKQLKKLIETGNYDIVHCHTPNASVITRLVCRKFRKENGLKVFYTAHGFHFYKGAPKLNWILYYSIEKFCSRFTDKLITINTEDYKLAKKRFKAKEIHYCPGVGIDLSRFKDVDVDRSAKRDEIGVPKESKLLLSVGELNENKNHQVIIRALAKLNDANIHYAIAGIGNKKNFLLDLAKELCVEEQVHLLGFRKDIPEINHISDVFCFPSKREGLGLVAIEAMSSGLPIITSNVHGINDYSVDGVTGYACNPVDVNCFAEAISKLISDPKTSKEIGRENIQRAKKYSVSNILEIMREIYEL